MSVLNIFLIFFGVVSLTLVILYLIRQYYNRGRMMDMVFLRIAIPKQESKEDREREKEGYSAGKDFKEKLNVATHLFESLHSIHEVDWKYKVLGQDFLSFEYAVLEGKLHCFIVVPRSQISLLEKQITAFYPESYVEEVPDYNIFQEDGKVDGIYLKLAESPILPIKTYARMGYDPFNTVANALSKIGEDEGAAIQFLVRPCSDGWQKKGRELAKQKFSQTDKKGLFKWNPLSWIGTWISILFQGATQANVSENFDQSKHMTRTTPLTDEEVKAMEEKNTKVGFETVIRIVASSNTRKKAREHVTNIRNAFAQYTTTTNNSFMKTKYVSVSKVVINFIYRTLWRNWTQRLSRRRMILSADELASLWHVPNVVYNHGPNIAWQMYKIAPPPDNLPTDGILVGHNFYRGQKKEIRMKNDDRFRHFYIIGQTGTGKSSTLQVLIRQDLAAGKGLCVIDPHGSLIEDILPFIPRERADDVIYFDPSDLERPMGLNLLEADTEPERDLVAMDAMNIMLKLFDEEVFGPRIQDYFRNGCLTLMEDPEGGALTDVVRLFTDDDFQKYKVEKVKNPIVKSFWIHQMAKTGQREKQEMIPYFAAKFGQFVTNTMMRNIIGQTKSAFDFNDVMQEGKILLMNLSKGETGELNSKLLGLIITSKLQMAALRRQRVAKEQRRDFFLYIDEFQNYVTDSVEVILSEARKYRLGLIMAHQYLAQIEEGEQKKGAKKVSIKDAVFGNVGTIMAYKIGAQDAEYMAKEFAPVFSDQDLINVDKYKAVMKLSIDTQPSRPFSVIPLNPYLEKGDAEIGPAVKQLSRLKYGRDRDFVNREIIRRIGAET